jgi:hypothetical protein
MPVHPRDVEGNPRLRLVRKRNPFARGKEVAFFSENDRGCAEKRHGEEEEVWDSHFAGFVLGLF